MTAEPTALTAQELEIETLRLQRAAAELALQEAQDAADRARRERAAAAKEERERIAAEKEAAAAATTQAAEDKLAKAREDRRKATIANIGAVSAGLNNLTGSSLTLPEKAVFRESLVASTALKAAARNAAEAIVAAAKGTHAGAETETDREVAAHPGPILVTGRTDQAEAALAALSFKAAVDELNETAERVLGARVEEAAPRRVAAKIRALGAVAADEAEAEVMPSADSLVGAAINVGVAAVNALSIETAIDATERTASERETHVAVISALLARSSSVLHETIGIPSATNGLLAAFAALDAKLAQLDAKARGLQRAIDKLDKEKDKEFIRALDELKALVEAIATRITNFVQTANETDAATESTPLRAAMRAYQLVGGEAGAPEFVAVVLPARINAHQIALKRRLFSPRLIVSASAEIDVVVLGVRQRNLVGAGTYVEEAAFQVRFPMWWWAAESSFTPKYSVLKGTMPGLDTP